MDELLKCPYCGGEIKVYQTNKYRWYCTNTECNIESMNHFETEQQAIAHANRRAGKTYTKIVTINGYEIKEDATYWGTKVMSRYVTIDGESTEMTYIQACNWAKRTDRRKK